VPAAGRQLEDRQLTKETQIMPKRPMALMAGIVLILGFASSLAVAQTGTQGQPDWKAQFPTYDRNKDGRIDRGEYQDWMTDVFYLRDKGHKGYLVQEDVAGILSPETLKAINRKGDGKLSLQEFLNATFQDFAAADVNQDGTLSLAEIEAYIGKAGK
jgi:Ca2+-binding EF-hand superfamily protein